MLDQVFHSYTYGEWLIASTAIFLLGIAKGGIKGLGTILTILLLIVFGSKASTGIIMPLLIIGDVFAVIYYNRHADWSYLKKLIPWILFGVIIGVWYGKDLPEEEFRYGMGAVIIISIILMWILERKASLNFPQRSWFAGVMGVLSGFATMVGNLAGPFSEIYFLAIRVSKETFIGTTAWLFLIVNVFKLPFHIWSWKTIYQTTLWIDLILLLPLLLGLWVGVVAVKRIEQEQFRRLIMILTTIGAVLIFFQ